MSSVKSRREQHSEATRAALLETATALFAERGYAATALEDVASATQVTRGAVYHHFASKAVLFEAVVADQESQAMHRIATAAAAAADAWTAALIGLDAFLDECLDPVYSRLVWVEGPVALGHRRWQEIERRYAHGMIEGFVAHLMDGGFIQRTDLQVTTRLLFGLLGEVGGMLTDTDEPDKARVRNECALITRRLLDGLRPPSS